MEWTPDGWVNEDHGCKRALIVVDVQNDFCEGGSLAVKGGTEVALHIGNMLTPDTKGNYRHRYDVVVATEDYHVAPGSHFSETPDFRDSWPAHCVAGTYGAQRHSALAGAGIDGLFRKGRFSAAYSGFEGTSLGVSLGAWLKRNRVSEVDVCGLALDYCVKATALDAAKAGFKTAVLLSMTAAVSEDTGRAALEELRAADVQLMGELVAA